MFVAQIINVRKKTFRNPVHFRHNWRFKILLLWKICRNSIKKCVMKWKVFFWMLQIPELVEKEKILCWEYKMESDEALKTISQNCFNTIFTRKKMFSKLSIHLYLSLSDRLNCIKLHLHDNCIRLQHFHRYHPYVCHHSSYLHRVNGPKWFWKYENWKNYWNQINSRT